MYIQKNIRIYALGKESSQGAQGLIVKREALQSGEGVLVRIDPSLLGPSGAAAVTLVEVGAARGAQPQAVLTAEHDKRGIHDHGV